jgi:hypothetical protein
VGWLNHTRVHKTTYIVTDTFVVRNIELGRLVTTCNTNNIPSDVRVSTAMKG